MVSLGQKLNMPKTCEKPFYKNIRVVLCSVEKTARKNTRYSRNKVILKIGHLAQAIAHEKPKPLQNGQFGSKIKYVKNKRKTILQEYWNCSVEKTDRNNTKYSRNKITLNINHLAKAIAFAKLSVWVKN